MRSFYQNWKLDQNLPLAIFQSKDMSFYPHFHAEVELVYVESGSIIVGVNEEKRQLKQGDMAICGSNDIHYFESKGLSSTVIITIFHPDLVGKSATWPAEFRFQSPFVSAGRPELEPIHPLLRRIWQEKSEAKPGYPLFVQSGLLELCGLLQRHLPVRSPENGSGSRTASKKVRIQQILSYIEEHSHEDLSVDEMSERFRMEPSYFCRTFKKAIGMNFKTYLNTIRVLNATRKLENSEASITDIALECGFGSVRTFNRVYKELQGYPPSVRRKENM
ncbi:AraC family transcriptional regulator [Paenibacillus sp. M1]|uniref:AraC family transcriptional regulator n=1 Tax=Paenibacillus haidiansis TaxID=1574488 RepID=A0ABU7VN86_9BACL